MIAGTAGPNTMSKQRTYASVGSVDPRPSALYDQTLRERLCRSTRWSSPILFKAMIAYGLEISREYA
jgi:hypothetical protein